MDRLRLPTARGLARLVVLGGAAALVVATGAAGSAIAAPRAAVAVPARLASTSSMKVTPTTGLAGGDTVRVTATEITPSASVQVIQCDEDDGVVDDDCSATLTTTASTSGGVSVKLTLADPVWRSQEIGDSIPVYCRADQCHIFLAWTDSANHPEVLSSRKLFFTGAPATIAVSQATNLHGQQLIGVRGTAFGAQGHEFEVLEEACYVVVQGSGCYGALSAVDGVIGKNGRFYVHYRVRQHLADGSNCNDPNLLGECELTVIVLTKGKPDDSFGVASIGQPLAVISFRGSGG